MNKLKRSKVYRYELGHVEFMTPTVAELIEFLQQFPSDMPVVAEWEGQIKGFGYTETRVVDGEPALSIDVEFNITEED